MNMKNETMKLMMRMAVVMLIVLAASDTWASQVQLDVALSTPAIMAGEKQTAYLRVAMTGFELKDESERTPVNVAIVLDKSGSMQGDKIRQAREAAIMAIGKLRDNDIVSVVTYDTCINVVVPATKVSDRDRIYKAIRGIQAGGNTALFAGVSKGANEVRKFLSKNRVNRVVLLSDGLANSGPSTPAELGELGRSLGQEGIAVTTIGLGLGYNEDLMTELAQRSDGNHMFAENATDLARAFDNEFGDVLSVVAQEVTVRIQCAQGIRPVRLLGREGDIAGQRVTTTLNQIYSEQMKYVLLEVEVPAGRNNTAKEVATVEVSYANMATKTNDRLKSNISIAFVDSPEEVERRTNKEVMVAAIRQIGMERNEAAMKLRDEGKIEEARDLFTSNSNWLGFNSVRFDSRVLKEDMNTNRASVSNLAPGDWAHNRKVIKAEQYKAKAQQQEFVKGKP